MNLNKILKIVVAVIAVIGVFFLLRVLSAGDEEIKLDAGLQDSIVSPFITVSIIVLIATAAIALIFSLKNIASDSAKLKKTAISVVAFLIAGFGLIPPDLIPFWKDFKQI